MLSLNKSEVTPLLIRRTTITLSGCLLVVLLVFTAYGPLDNETFMTTSADHSTEKREISKLIEEKEITNLKLEKQEITSEENTFQIQSYYPIEEQSDEQERKWTVHKLHSEFYYEINQDKNDNVTVSGHHIRGPEYENKVRGREYEKEADLTEEFRELNIDLDDDELTFSNTNIARRSETSIFEFKVSDGENHGYLSVTWEDGEHTETLSLHDHDIVDTGTQIYRVELKKFSEQQEEQIKDVPVDIYLYEHDNSYYLVESFRNIKQDQIEHDPVQIYSLPDDIIEITGIYPYDSWYSDRKIALIGKNDNQQYHHYSFHLDKQQLKQGMEVDLWRNEDKYQWKSHSRLGYNHLVDKTADNLLIVANDGLESGYHDNLFLYSLDRETGGINWKYDADLFPVEYYLSGDEQDVFINQTNALLTNKDPVITSKDMSTGDINWQKELSREHENEPRISAHIVKAEEMLIIYQHENSNDTFNPEHTLLGIEPKSGETIWEQELEPGTYELTEIPYHENVILLKGEDEASREKHEIIALNSKTGEQEWSKNKQNVEHSSNPGLDIMNECKLYPEHRESIKWFFSKDDLTQEEDLYKIDLNTGETLDSFPVEGNKIFWLTNDLIAQEDHLYSIKEDKILWENNHRLKAASKGNENEIFLVTEEEIISYCLKKDDQNWSQEFAISGGTDGVRPFNVSKKPFVRDDELIVPGRDKIFVLKRETGEIKHYVGNISLYETLDNSPYHFHYYYMVQPLGDSIYIGSRFGDMMKID